MLYSYRQEIPLPMIITALVLGLLMIVSLWKVFEKAGQPGWASIVPVYNLITLFKIAGKEWWSVFLVLIPIYNIVVLVQMWHAISLAFGKSTGFTVGLVLAGMVFVPILAFSDAEYKPGRLPNSNAPLDQI